MIYKHWKDFKGEWKWDNFSPEEMSCKCCGEYYHDPDSLDLAQKFRNILGRSIRANSYHRCVTHNKNEGGRKKSKHLEMAFDWPIIGDRKEFLQMLFDAGFTTFGMYVGFVHADKRSYRKWYGCKQTIWGNIYNEVVKKELVK